MNHQLDNLCLVVLGTLIIPTDSLDILFLF